MTVCFCAASDRECSSLEEKAARIANRESIRVRTSNMCSQSVAKLRGSTKRRKGISINAISFEMPAPAAGEVLESRLNALHHTAMAKVIQFHQIGGPENLK